METGVASGVGGLYSDDGGTPTSEVDDPTTGDDQNSNPNQNQNENTNQNQGG